MGLYCILLYYCVLLSDHILIFLKTRFGKSYYNICIHIGYLFNIIFFIYLYNITSCLVYYVFICLYKGYL